VPVVKQHHRHGRVEAVRAATNDQIREAVAVHVREHGRSDDRPARIGKARRNPVRFVTEMPVTVIQKDRGVRIAEVADKQIGRAVTVHIRHRQRREDEKAKRKARRRGFYSMQLPFIAFGLVAASVYGFVLYTVVTTANRGASDNRMALLAVVCALGIGTIFALFSFSWLAWHRYRIRQIEKRYPLDTLRRR
jgi:hypothetical protein